MLEKKANTPNILQTREKYDLLCYNTTYKKQVVRNNGWGIIGSNILNIVIITIIIIYYNL